MLLAREVDHRARNALAVIQSIIRLTRAKTVDDYVQAIEGRIKALARAHTLLSDSRWHGADLGDAGRRGTRALSRRRQDRRSAGPISRCSRRPRRAWRWRCTSLPPTPPSTARCRRPAARSRSTGNCSRDALTLNWAETGGPADRRAVVAQLRPEGHRRQHRAAAWRQGGVRLGSERPALRILDTAQRADEIAGVQCLARNGGRANGAGHRARNATRSRACFWSRTRRWSP